MAVVLPSSDFYAMRPTLRPTRRRHHSDLYTSSFDSWWTPTSCVYLEGRWRREGHGLALQYLNGTGRRA